jgi:uncharacterized protein (UPF0333 family)
MKRMILAALLAASTTPALAADTSEDRKAVASSTDEARAQAVNARPGAAKECNCHVKG